MWVTASSPTTRTSPRVIVVLPDAESPTMPSSIGRAMARTVTPPLRPRHPAAGRSGGAPGGVGERHVDELAADLDGMRGDARVGAQRCAGREVVAAFVQRADDRSVADDPVCERTAAVRADGVQRIPARGGAEDRDAATADRQRAPLARRDIVDAAGERHRRPPAGGPMSAGSLVPATGSSGSLGCAAWSG